MRSPRVTGAKIGVALGCDERVAIRSGRDGIFCGCSAPQQHWSDRPGSSRTAGAGAYMPRCSRPRMLGIVVGRPASAGHMFQAHGEWVEIPPVIVAADSTWATFLATPERQVWMLPSGTSTEATATTGRPGTCAFRNPRERHGGVGRRSDRVHNLRGGQRDGD